MRRRRILQYVSGVLIAGILVHFGTRDRFPLLHLLYYALPLPVLALLSVGISLGWLRIGDRKAAAVFAAMALALTGWTRHSNYVAPRLPETRPRAHRLLLWNVASGRWKEDTISSVIESARPDIVVLLETGGPSMEAHWRQVFEDWHLSQGVSGTLVATAFPIAQDQAVNIGTSGRCRHVSVLIDGDELNLLVTDIKSNPLASRRDPLSRLAEPAQTLEKNFTIVLGDFNTPGESVWFEPLREYYREAFELAGQGWKCTWPIPIPVLDLDHVWLSRHIKALNAEHRWTPGSDHSPVIVDFALD